jgi:NAD(P)-dependent dehydrogenase (short-subunit alcohol dehydrogenase family)
MFKINVIGNIHLFNLFMPLILKGNAKKVLTISSGMADMEQAREFNLTETGPYSISKAAVNMAVAKFSAEYAKDGVLFLSVCPGSVDTGVYADSKSYSWLAVFQIKKANWVVVSEEKAKKLAILTEKFMRMYCPCAHTICA